MAMAPRADYGIDAPGVIRGLALGGMVVLAAAVAAAAGASLGWASLVLLALGLVFLAEAALMLLYARTGKFRHRDHHTRAISAWLGSRSDLRLMRLLDNYEPERFRSR